MIFVLFCKDLYSKIVNTKTKSCSACFVFPYTSCRRTGEITILCKVRDELSVGQYCSLFEAIHAFINLNANLAIAGNLGGNVIFGLDVVEKIL